MPHRIGYKFGGLGKKNRQGPLSQKKKKEIVEKRGVTEEEGRGIEERESNVKVTVLTLSVQSEGRVLHLSE